MSAGLHLKDWIPQLAREIHGKKWSPNHDLTTHLEAQQEAKRAGVQWSAVMAPADVWKICYAVLDRYRR